MNSILSDLYCGNINPVDQIYPKDPDYKHLNREYLEHCNEFDKRLSELDPSLRSQFSSLLDEYTSIHTCESLESFNYGFSLGARIMLEVLTSNF